ncbi:MULTISPECIES: hypothetical protein [unclassified Microcoleus]|uniref:DUF6959 family protein n=1 Tax=unclassified Microcoleus TaxID=2642155 RepID=UPI001DC11360|nr:MULTISPECIES: hypothetical protein [unclassified Microcoleus]MCC3595806.1 hypothetical protein [Microcoleus sp. PH2017_26_ELK_O_A]MCC3620608.1 hypothetical protein [Microcoleus sp. PH2017_36_ELK_O_B]
MQPNEIKIFSYLPNSAIVQLPERIFPGIILQGDSLSILFDQAKEIYLRAKQLPDEDIQYEALMMAEVMQEYLSHYEEALKEHGLELPYGTSIRERKIQEE